MGYIATYYLIGVTVHAFTVDTFFDAIRHSIEQKMPCIIANHNLHSIYLYHHDATMRQFYSITHYVFIDGMPLIIWGKLLGLNLKHANRFTSVDWLPLLMQRCAAEGWGVYYLGGKPGVAERGAAILRARYPDLDLQTAHGFFDIHDETANAEIVDAINASQANLLLVGMGMPRQEQWLYAHRDQLQVPCMLPVGAGIDYIAGEIPIPSRRMSRWGFEWLARLITEPRRLGWRYLVEPWFLLPYMLRDLQQRRRQEND